MQIVLGIDIGTTHCKLVAVDLSGRVVHTATGNYGTGNHFEQDAQLIFERVSKLMEDSIAALDHEIRGVCFSGAMHSIMAVDANGKPLTRAFTWADTRSNDCAMQLKQLPNATEIYLATGTPVHPMSPLSKICWMRETMPEIFAVAHKFISIKEYIIFKLFGEYLIDHSIASATGLFDIYSLQWHEGALKAAGIEAAKLSKPVPVSFELRIGHPNLSRLHHVPFFIGGSDGCLANLGSGVLSKGEASVTIGTSGAVRITVDRPVQDPQQRLFNYILTDGLYVSGGAINNGGSALKWIAEHLSLDLEALLPLAQESPAGANGLIFLPYLSGERAPFWDALARGAFIGLQTSHGKQHLVRAVFEGVAYALRQVLLTVDENIEIVYGSGAFTRYEFWCQLMADVLGKKIITQESDASAVGAAFLAWHGLHEIVDLKEIKPLVRNIKTFTPEAAKHAVYNRYFDVYAGLYPKLAGSFHQLAGLK